MNTDTDFRVLSAITFPSVAVTHLIQTHRAIHGTCMFEPNDDKTDYKKCPYEEQHCTACIDRYVYAVHEVYKKEAENE